MSSSEEHVDRYIEQAQRGLIAFQMVEEALKLYIANAYILIQFRLAGFLPFRFEGKEVAGYPLERLIGNFRKLTDNEALISKLNKLPRYRNHCAHQAYVIAYLRTEEQIDFQKGVEELREGADLGWECMRELREELSVVSEQLRRARVLEGFSE